MAIVKGGISKQLSGSYGGVTITQHKNGTTSLKAKNKKSEKPRTGKQLSVQQDQSICSAFGRAINGFIRIGYALEIKRTGADNAFNALSSHVRSVITGEYPNRRIDYSRVLVTKGEMTPPENASVTVTDRGLFFSWDPRMETDGQHYSDHVMLMAYFEGKREATFKIAGAPRREGKDYLLISDEFKGEVAEVYISLIKDEQDSVSDSVYLGQITC
jgi:hypothetical protein